MEDVDAVRERAFVFLEASKGVLGRQRFVEATHGSLEGRSIG